MFTDRVKSEPYYGFQWLYRYTLLRLHINFGKIYVYLLLIIGFLTFLPGSQKKNHSEPEFKIYIYISCWGKLVFD